MAKSGLAVLLDRTAGIADAVRYLGSHRTMVGVPGDTAPRDGKISNAALAYIHNNGAPEAHVPARPHFVPGVRAVQSETEADLEKALEAALAGDRAAAERVYHRIGLRAVNSIRAVIRAKIAPDLAESTVEGRIRRVGGQRRRDKLRATLALDPGAARSLFTPLIVTGAYIRSITYVVRKIAR